MRSRFARQRVQSAKFGGRPARNAVRIIEHADVRRTLMTCRALTEATRALVYLNAAAVDRAHAGEQFGSRRSAHPDLQGLGHRCRRRSRVSLALQVFGGMGYVEETGAAQFLRDARIAPIYEGTNGIQALDLVGRKLAQDGGAHWQEVFAQVGDTLAELDTDADLAGLAPWLDDALAATRSATLWLTGNNNPDDVAAGATPYLRMMGLTLGGWLLARQALVAAAALKAGNGDPAFLKAKIATARFYAEQILPQVSGAVWHRLLAALQHFMHCPRMIWQHNVSHFGNEIYR